MLASLTWLTELHATFHERPHSGLSTSIQLLTITTIHCVFEIDPHRYDEHKQVFLGIFSRM